MLVLDEVWREGDDGEERIEVESGGLLRDVVGFTTGLVRVVGVGSRLLSLEEREVVSGEELGKTDGFDG